MIGNKYGKLLVIEYAGVKKTQKSYICKCDCGNEVVVLSNNLKKGNSKSCGCSRVETCRKRMLKLNFRHGETNTKLWKTWKGILGRTTCQTNSHYARYGGRGIGICEAWKIYENFAKYIGPPPTNNHSIDRINNNKGYEPGNIRWASAKEQAANRSTNIKVLINGQIMILSDAAKKLSISKSTASRWAISGKLQLIEQ